MTHAATKPAAHETNLKESAAAVKDAVVDLAGEANRYVRHRATDARDSAAAMVETARSRAADCNDTVVGFIRENPYKSLVFAAGVGLVAGILIRRR